MTIEGVGVGEEGRNGSWEEIGRGTAWVHQMRDNERGQTNPPGEHFSLSSYQSKLISL